MLIISILLIGATLIDFKFYRIPNWLVIVGTIMGLMLHPDNLGKKILQMMVVFIVFYPFFLIKGIGAGDIKLFMMLSLYFEKEKIFLIVAISFFLAAVISIIKILFDRNAREQLYKGLGFLRKLVITKTLDPYECNKTNKNTMVRMSLPITIATVIGGFIL